jgi:hypothetical protein
MNNFFIDQFGTFDYKHANSILVTTLDASKNIDDKKMTVHFSEGHFEIIVIQNQKLLFLTLSIIKLPKISFIMFYSPQSN